MAKASVEQVTEVVREDVTLTMSREEAEQILSLIGKCAGGTMHALYRALTEAGVKGEAYRVEHMDRKTYLHVPVDSALYLKKR
jgi:hypothetical protein